MGPEIPWRFSLWASTVSPSRARIKPRGEDMLRWVWNPFWGLFASASLW